MTHVGATSVDAPPEIAEVDAPRIRREVWLRTGDRSQVHGYAVSWWNASEVDGYLENRALPIWSSLSKNRTELFRDVRGACASIACALVSACGVAVRVGVMFIS
jgi:chorismate--pyruvate lyase